MTHAGGRRYATGRHCQHPLEGEQESVYHSRSQCSATEHLGLLLSLLPSFLGYLGLRRAHPAISVCRQWPGDGVSSCRVVDMIKRGLSHAPDPSYRFRFTSAIQSAFGGGNIAQLANVNDNGEACWNSLPNARQGIQC